MFAFAFAGLVKVAFALMMSDGIEGRLHQGTGCGAELTR